MKAFKPSPDRKMIKLLTSGNFPATTLRTLSRDDDDDDDDDNNNVKKQLVL